MSNHLLSARGATNREDTSNPIETTGRMAVSSSGLFAQWLRGLTINAHERLALAHLWEHGSMTMSELGARIPLSRAAVTALTDRLEALGYVLRTPDEHDRRRTVLSMTDRPEQLIAPMVGAWRSDVEQFAASFSDEERRAIARWNEGLRSINHVRATALRARNEGEIPVAEEHRPSSATDGPRPTARSSQVL